MIRPAKLRSLNENGTDRIQEQRHPAVAELHSARPPPQKPAAAQRIARIDALSSAISITLRITRIIAPSQIRNSHSATRNCNESLKDWTLDVGCWMFPLATWACSSAVRAGDLIIQERVFALVFA